jgi:glycine C-acetyltransferase
MMTTNEAMVIDQTEQQKESV